MHDECDHQQVFCVDVLFVDLWVSLVHSLAQGIPVADDFIDDQLLRHEEETLHWRNVFFCGKTHQFAIPAECHRVLHTWVFDSVFF